MNMLAMAEIHVINTGAGTPKKRVFSKNFAYRISTLERMYTELRSHLLTDNDLELRKAC